MSKLEFSLEDCQKIIDAFQSAPKNKASYNLFRQSTNEEILQDIRQAYAKYVYDKAHSTAPTSKQFLNELTNIQTSARRLKNKVINPKTHHLYSSLVFSELNGINLEHAEDEDFHPRFNETQQHLDSLVTELTWLITASEPLLNDELPYPRLRNTKDTREPETKFIISLSNILTKHFFTTGGYSKNQNTEEGATGWRVEAVKHLLTKVGVNKTKRQIYDAIE
jgi:hypothetical protein